jgi:large subunit ribosomal protein L27
MAHIKSGGTVKGNRDSIAKRLGIKLFTGNSVKSGAVLVRQRGTKIHAGDGCDVGGDDTVFAIKTGVVGFKTKRGKKYIFVK